MKFFSVTTVFVGMLEEFIKIDCLSSAPSVDLTYGKRTSALVVYIVMFYVFHLARLVFVSHVSFLFRLPKSKFRPFMITDPI